VSKDSSAVTSRVCAYRPSGSATATTNATTGPTNSTAVRLSQSVSQRVSE